MPPVPALVDAPLPPVPLAVVPPLPLVVLLVEALPPVPPEPPEPAELFPLPSPQEQSPARLITRAQQRVQLDIA